jgi:hypothetical protein
MKELNTLADQIRRELGDELRNITGTNNRKPGRIGN